MRVEKGGSQFQSAFPQPGGTTGGAEGGGGIDGDRRRITLGEDLPGVSPGDGDYSETLRAGQPIKGGGSCEATPSGLRREGQI
jgi:hypothetical protein